MNTNEESRKTKAKPFLKWVGGKTQLLEQYQQYFPKKFNKYFEPFLGGGAVFFHINPKDAELNDVNTKLINAYLDIKNNLEELIISLKKIEKDYVSKTQDERKEYFYNKRDEFNSVDLSVKKTALLIFLNKTCFNGMYRENSKGLYNVPFGSYKNPTILDELNLRLISDRLKKTKLYSRSYIDAVKNAKKGDFVYFDPPYHPVNETSSFTDYAQGGFGKEDQIALRDLFIDLDKRGCHVMLSNSHTPFIKDLYKTYRQEKVAANRFINSKASGRGKIKEILILNY